MNIFCDATIPFHTLKSREQRLNLAFLFCFLLCQLGQLGLSQTATQNSKSFETLYSEASALLVAGEFQAIIDGLGNQLIQSYPDEPDGFILYARALELAASSAIERSSLTQAEYYSAEAFKLQPSYPLAMRWAEIAWQNGKNTTAIEVYQKASETTQGRKEAWPHINIAKIYSFSGDKEKELSHLEIALDLLDSSSTSSVGKEAAAYIEVQLELASCYKSLNKLDRAIESYQAILAQDATHTKASQALQALLNSGE